ncbi:MAG: hypothetical protein ACK5XV_00965 [Flavobacteriales bacterium]
MNALIPYRLLLVCALGLAACNRGGSDDALVAQVGDKMLTWDEVRSVIPDNSTPEDSMLLADRFIQTWIREQVLLSEAEETLAEEQMNFEEQIENYRKSLLTYAYEQEWIRQKLDTSVTVQEIEAYYNENIQNFQLKDYIVKVKFCAIGSDTEQRKLKSLRKLFFSDKPEDITDWIAFCVDNNASYYFDEVTWMLWDDLMKQVPLQVFDKDAFLRSNRDVDFEKDNNIYLIRITDYQISGSQAPLNFEKENIRNMILNRRKLEILDRMREDLYTRALGDGQITTYYKQQ